MRRISSGANCSTSRNVSTCRSGITSRCVSAWGLMSRIATKPGAVATWSPSLYKRQNRQSSGSEDPLLRDCCAADTKELPDRPVDEPRRIVVAVAAAGAIDEDRVLSADLRPPALHRRRTRGRTEPCAALLLHLRRYRIAFSGHGSRPRRVRKDVHLRDPCLRNDGERVSERPLVFGREADDHVRSQVEVVAERLDAGEIAARGVAPCHLAENRVVARLQRHVEVPADGRRIAQGGDELVVYVVDLDRREPQARETGHC